MSAILQRMFVLGLFCALLFPLRVFSQQPAAIVGLWKNDQFGYPMALQLNRDGSGVFDGEALRYTVKESTLTITAEGESTNYGFSINENQLTLAGGDLDGKVIFSRAPVTERSPAFSATSRELIGLWAGEGEMIEFKADGSCWYNGTLFPYSVSQGHLIIKTTAGNVVFQYALQRGTLILTTNGQQSVYSRPAGSTVNASPKGGVKNPLELLGQWCYLNMTTNSQSSRCITLNADGTYRYTSESSRGVSTNELSSGTSSQGSESGTWYVQEDRIYYQSATKGAGSYRLEKRNHPKNVNDPMIVLDDEPFVTTTQRPPWR